MHDNQSFDYGDIHEVMWISTLSNMLTFDDNLRDLQLNARMQIYLPAALPYQVLSRLPFTRVNHLPYGRHYNVNYNADYNTRYNAQFVTKLYY